jgi:hypothetical protein
MLDSLHSRMQLEFRSLPPFSPHKSPGAWGPKADQVTAGDPCKPKRLPKNERADELSNRGEDYDQPCDAASTQDTPRQEDHHGKPNRANSGWLGDESDDALGD